MSNVKKKIRNSNIELLRVISMIMIVALHYMNQGGVLDKLSYGDENYCVSWIIESFCFVSVNCYVLISGYFLYTAKFNVQKLISLIFEVMFYSVGIYLLFCVISVETFSIATLVTGYLFPLIHGEYWFATVYVVLYMISPFINKWMDALTKDEHKKLILILGLVFSLIPSVIFFAGESIGIYGGYTLIWFIYVYIISVYLRKYDFKIKNRYLILTYLIASVINFAVKVAQQAVFGNELWNLYRYSSITVLIASVSLFMIFIQMKPRNHKIWLILGSTTFGVFLIHTQYIMRDKILWKEIIKPLDYCDGNTLVYLLHVLVSVLVIFIVCSLIDLLRIKLFSLADKALTLLRGKNKENV